MIIFKSCPKCGGDLNLRNDQYGPFVDCLQCGYLRDIASMASASFLDSAPTLVEPTVVNAIASELADIFQAQTG